MKIKLDPRLKTFFRKNKSHLFPMVLTVTLVLAAALQINGSSTGIYHQLLYGQKEKSSQIFFGNPELVRSDEWLVTTQLTVSQAQAGFPKINPYYNNGQDVSLITDVPYRDWSVIFKPQNLAFLVLPLSVAFAFKWWLLLYLLLISSYYFILNFLPNKRLFAIGGSLLIGCSPFVFWWYQTITIAPLFYGFFILLVGMNIIDNKKLVLFKKEIGTKTAAALRLGVFSYLLTAFCLILYPPFQIPIAICVAFFLLGYLGNKWRTDGIKSLKLPLSILLMSIVVLGAIIGAFLQTRLPAVEAISSTAYPGKRVVEPGGFSATRLLTSYLQPQLQNPAVGNKYILNQSESANFILLPFFLIVPSVALLAWLYKKKRQIDWLIVSLLASCAVLMSHLFLPFSSALSKLFLLHLVPQPRLIIGLGFLALILLTYLVTIFLKEKIKLSKKYVIATAVYVCLFFILSAYAGIKTSHEFPAFISNKIIIIGLAVLMVGSLGCFLLKRINLGIAGLAFLSMVSIITIHPLQRGLNELTDNKIVSTIKAISTKDDVWASDSLYFENFAQLSGRPSLTGVAFYPNTAFWRQYYPSAADEAIYNRYAHILANFDENKPIHLKATDSFSISLTCDEKILKKVDFILATQERVSPCLELQDKIVYPQITLYFYQVKH